MNGHLGGEATVRKYGVERMKKVSALSPHTGRPPTYKKLEERRKPEFTGDFLASELSELKRELIQERERYLSNLPPQRNERGRAER